MAEWPRRWCLRDLKSTVHDLEVMGLNPGWVKGEVCNTVKRL